MKSLFSYLVSSFCVVLSSCATYIDRTVTQVDVTDGYILSEKYSNKLVYKSTQKFTKDTEVIYPQSYMVELPKKLKNYYFGLMGNSWFDYGDDQFIIIIQNEGATSQKSSQLTEDEWEKLIIQNFELSGLHRLELDTFQLIDRRKSIVLTHDSVSIVLYNIKNKNFQKFVNTLQTLKTSRVPIAGARVPRVPYFLASVAHSQLQFYYARHVHSVLDLRGTRAPAGTTFKVRFN